MPYVRLAASHVLGHEVVMSRSLLLQFVLPLALGRTAGCSSSTGPALLPVSLVTSRLEVDVGTYSIDAKWGAL